MEYVCGKQICYKVRTVLILSCSGWVVCVCLAHIFYGDSFFFLFYIHENLSFFSRSLFSRCKRLRKIYSRKSLIYLQFISSQPLFPFLRFFPTSSFCSLVQCCVICLLRV
uniref:Uncharacterized protein n=1 Tax=Cacopsylla melanoneura TaxID=428564 RepID=A0A8D9E990_9HEMI